MSIGNEIQDLEKQMEELAQRKQQLLEEKQREEARLAKLDELVNNSDYDSPKALVEALIQKFNIRVGSLGGGSASTGKRRSRTTVTAELRDRVKGALAEGFSKNKVAKSLGISYLVVAKIEKGKYDNL